MARTSIIGTSGTGKSWYSGYLLEQAVPNFDFAVHFDIEDEELGLSSTETDHEPLYKTVEIDEELFGNVDLLRVLYRNKKIRVVPQDLVMEESREVLGTLCAAAMKLGEEGHGSVFVSVDEAHNLLSEGNLDERVERLITGGRKHKVEFLSITQRPQLIDKTVLSQSNRRCYLRVDEQNDIDKINKVSTFDAERLKNLRDRRVIVENRDTGETTEINTENLERKRPHYSADDGISDEALPV